MNRVEFDAAELAIDAPNQFVDGTAEIFVFFNILSGWNGDLDKLDLTNPLRVGLEEVLKSVQFLWNSFDVVQTVDTDDELGTSELFLKLLDTFLYLRPLESFCKFIWINSDRESSDCDNFASEFDSIRGSNQATV